MKAACVRKINVSLCSCWQMFIVVDGATFLTGLNSLSASVREFISMQSD